MLVAQQPNQQSALRMADENVRRIDVRIAKQHMKLFFPLHERPGCRRLAPSIAGPIVGAHFREWSDLVLYVPPLKRWRSGAGFDNHRRDSITLTQDMNRVATDFDHLSRD